LSLPQLCPCGGENVRLRIVSFTSSAKASGKRDLLNVNNSINNIMHVSSGQATAGQFKASGQFNFGQFKA
jgi:hypothetical protein